MARKFGLFFVALAICAIYVAACSSARAATIIELSLGDSSTDIEYNGAFLQTVDDGDAATTGQQDTGVLFQNFIDSYAPDILLPTASFTLSGLVPSGPATVFNGSLVIQQFAGGTISLYDSSNILLLSANLGASAMTGSLGVPTGGLFQSTAGTVTAGSLLPYVDPNSLFLSMNFTSIKDTPTGNIGLRVIPMPPPSPPPIFNSALSPFRADATVDIEANAPEPTGVVLLALAAISTAAVTRLRLRR
jgi:hypothetical protein